MRDSSQSPFYTSGVRRILLALLFALSVGAAHAQDWGNIAVISGTMGNNTNRLCIGDGSRPTDIGCPTYAPSLTTAGDVSISGNVSANKFIGDGSGLTGVATNLSETIYINDLIDAYVSGTGLTQSIFLGAHAGDSLTTGTYNVALGYSALASVTTSFRNTAVGPQTLANITDSTKSLNNVAFGFYAGNLATVARNSVIVGAEASRNVSEISNSVIVGFQAASAAGTRTINAALLGYKAGASLTSSTNNTLIGMNAGINLTTGSDNIMLGYNVSAKASSTNFGLNIGNSIFGDMTNAKAGGGAALVGVNIITPTVSLEVSGTVSATRFVGDGSGLTGVAQGDRITSGTAFVKAVQNQGGEVSGTLKLTSTGSETCGPSTYNTIRINPATNRLEICRP